jgi:hypothetical protein
MDASPQLHAQAALPPRKKADTHLKWGFGRGGGGGFNCFGSFVEVKKFAIPVNLTPKLPERW